MPVGPRILWRLNTRKSQPMACTSTGQCPADCAASTSVATPSARARAHHSAAGLIVPIVFEMCVKAKIFTSGREQFVELRQIEHAAVTEDGDVDELRAGAPGELLPRDEVGVVLQFGEQDFVAGLDVPVAPGGGDEVDGFGRAAREDDLGRLCRVDEPGGAFAGALVGGGGAVAQFVDAAVDVAVVVLVVAADRVDHRARLLAAGPAVEVDERFAVNLLVENGKVTPQGGPVGGGSGGFGEIVHGLGKKRERHLNLESF